MFPCGTFREAVRIQGDMWACSPHARGVRPEDSALGLPSEAVRDWIESDLWAVGRRQGYSPAERVRAHLTARGEKK